ncbi:MAG: hypothetical protein WD768_06045 [Phycisphaeraceae bacterium]
MIRSTNAWMWTVALVALLAGGVLTIAQDKADDTKKPVDPAKQSAEDIEKKLRERLKEEDAKNGPKPPAPKVEPKAEPKTDGKDEEPIVTPKIIRPQGVAPSRIDQPDANVIGTAPGTPAPKLRREGEFVLSRRGRLIKSTSGQSMFAFDADGATAAEGPMYLLPCRLLESMEGLVADQSEELVFVLSGQVFVYRGANYLLPTLMKPAIDKGNLKK